MTARRAATAGPPAPAGGTGVAGAVTDGAGTDGLVTEGAVDLVAVAEPVALRDRWWAAERAGAKRPDLVDGVTDAAWRRWRGPLGTAGVDRAWLRAVAAAYGRELWLWLVGERTWEQASTGLAGRVRRRLLS